MKVSLAFLETLVWHDCPLLFVAKDSIGGLYLCLATEDTGDELPRYTAVAVSNERLQALKLGKIDLHSVFARPELGSWFRVTSFEDTQAFIEPLVGVTALPDEMLPKPGEYLPRRSRLQPEAFESLKIGAVAKEAGMNPTLLRQYVSGFKIPSPEQARRVQEALHRVGKRLMETQFV